MIIRQLFDPASSTYTYLVADLDARVAALIDPVKEHLERDLRLLRELELVLVHVLDTHVHADHVTAAGALRERTGAVTCAGATGAPCVDRRLLPGDVVRVGAIAITALATPGHTDDSLSFLVPGAVFTGDALLVRGCGRTDFQNGDPGTLFDVITGTLFALPDDTVVYPGHDYQGRTVSSIGEEKRWNPRLAGKTRDEFIALMNGLGLPPPRQLAIAVPANRACGITAADPREEPVPTPSPYDTGQATPGGYRDVSPVAALAARGVARLIDVREPDEYTGELGHLPGAELVPLATVADVARTWDRARDVVLICRSGGRSGRAADALVAAGFQRVMNLAGGMLAYRAAGLPVTQA
jgi:sulfur dioxygenase